MLEVELDRVADEDDPTEATWMAEWGLREDDMGIGDSSDDLAELIAAIIDSARSHWADRYRLTIEWTLGGDAPPGTTVHDAIAAAGVTLPTTVT